MTHLVAVISQLYLAFWTSKFDGMCPVKARSQAITVATKKYWVFSENPWNYRGGTLRIDVHDIVASDATVFVLCTVSATRSDRYADFLEVHLWRIVDGHPVEFREFQGDEYTENKFWA
jgi:hypothetical protein